MPTIFWDIETRSTLALEAVGAWRYAADFDNGNSVHRFRGR